MVLKANGKKTSKSKLRDKIFLDDSLFNFNRPFYSYVLSELGRVVQSH